MPTKAHLVASEQNTCWIGQMKHLQWYDEKITVSQLTTTDAASAADLICRKRRKLLQKVNAFFPQFHQ